jgi:hypothetical protein
VLDFLISHICANEEYRSQVGATNRLANIVIPYFSVVSLSLVYLHANTMPSNKFGTLHKVVDVFIYRFFTGLSLRLRAHISKVTAHKRIQNLYLPRLRFGKISSFFINLSAYFTFTNSNFMLIIQNDHF